MSKPLVSVVIPTYSREKKLIRAIESVLHQTYPYVEIIVVDDNPRRDLSNVVPAVDRLSLINHESNKGVAGARNSGIAASNGQYIAFLDDDDTWIEKKNLRCRFLY